MGTAVFGIGVATFGLIALAFLAGAAWEVIKLIFKLIAGFFSK
ncbi:hypothetical protein [Selenomonas sp. FC4001]|nr:hypothetical protein [Selenomonas sp. FC4001]